MTGMGTNPALWVVMGTWFSIIWSFAIGCEIVERRKYKKELASKKGL